MSNDLVLNLSHHAGKQVQSVHVMGDQRYYDHYKGDDEGLERIEITFTDGSRIVASMWTSEMGGLCIDEGEDQ
jgi:hypothetical protein